MQIKNTGNWVHSKIPLPCVQYIIYKQNKRFIVFLRWSRFCAWGLYFGMNCMLSHAVTCLSLKCVLPSMPFPSVGEVRDSDGAEEAGSVLGDPSASASPMSPLRSGPTTMPCFWKEHKCKHQITDFIHSFQVISTRLKCSLFAQLSAAAQRELPHAGQVPSRCL